MTDTDNTADITPLQRQARAFDEAAESALDCLTDTEQERLLHAVYPDGPGRRQVGTQAFRAALVGAEAQFYNDVLAGRRGQAGTVLLWVRAWGAWRSGATGNGAGFGLPELPVLEILGLES